MMRLLERFAATVAVAVVVMSVDGPVAGAMGSPPFVQGYVFLDRNQNGTLDWRDPGIPGVAVSNGKEVVLTDARGYYRLPAYPEMVVFVSKPAGYLPPLDANYVPRFSYVHAPSGSPANIKQFAGVAPTGPLPTYVNFPLHRDDSEAHAFKAIVTGDMQPYTDAEVSFVRDSFVKEAHDQPGAFLLTMGDNVGDNLALYPRLLGVLGELRRPIWLVPGNHDVNYDTVDQQHEFETFKRVFGPPYYSFNYGKVHFVVLNDINYPAPELLPKKGYHGEIDATQMTWLANDLAVVPKDHLVVLSMHIPVVSDVDRLNPQHNVANRAALYKLLAGRKVVALAGHTHTLDNFQPGEQMEGWGAPLPFPEVIVGATCGSWWSGDLDNNGIPMSYQRDGAPRGYMIWSFRGNEYVDDFRASGKSSFEQMHVSFRTAAFDTWFNGMLAWANQSASTRPAAPPYTLASLGDAHSLRAAELATTTVVANVWNGSRDSRVSCVFDDSITVGAQRNWNVGDPYAQRLEAYVFRYAMGFNLFGTSQYGPAAPQPEDAGNIMQNSFHIWTCDLPTELEPGAHSVAVTAADAHGRATYQRIAFEVTK